jgi:hypothetical protein
MAVEAGHDVSNFLARARAGDQGARGEVICRIYDERGRATLSLRRPWSTRQ